MMLVCCWNGCAMINKVADRSEAEEALLALVEDSDCPEDGSELPSLVEVSDLRSNDWGEMLDGEFILV